MVLLLPFGIGSLAPIPPNKIKTAPIIGAVLLVSIY
jgi:hypothetical protein